MNKDTSIDLGLPLPPNAFGNHGSGAPNDPLLRLIAEFSKLPGIGEKTAARLAYYLLRQEAVQVRRLAQALIDAKEKIQSCERCFNFAETTLCTLCQRAESKQRDYAVLCVVEKPSDVQVIERSGAHRGTYHVLHGVLSPLEGIGPEELKLKELLKRLQSEPVQEIIVALNPSVEGEATAVYLQRLLKPIGVRVTKLAYGLQVGGVLEYTDQQTLGKALENRVEMH